MNGIISRLIDSEQFGTIACEDGREYVFGASALVDVSFGSLALGTQVTFTPASGHTRRAEAIRLQKKVKTPP